MPESIGFIGLGIMGKSMAHNLLKAGFPLVVQNRHQEITDEFLAAGARAGTRPRDIAASCDVVITSPAIVLGSLEVQDYRRGKQVCFDNVGPDYCEFETACKRSGCRRDGQVWHQTCPGFGHLDAYPAQDGQRGRKGPDACVSPLEFRDP